MASVTQPGASFIFNPAGYLPEEATGSAALPSPAPRPLEELTFGCKVNYILTPMYPQHMTLTEYEISAVKTSMENAVDARAVGIVANTLKARLSATEQELRTVLGDLQSHDQAPPPALHTPQGPLGPSTSPTSRVTPQGP